MKEEFQARMLRIHFTEADKWHGKPLHEAIVAKCQELGLAGATVYRGLEGFGASARIYHARSLSFSKEVPIMVSVIDTEDQIQKLIPHLDQMITGGLIASSTVKASKAQGEGDLSVLSTCVTKQTGDMVYSEARRRQFLSFGQRTTMLYALERESDHGSTSAILVELSERRDVGSGPVP